MPWAHERAACEDRGAPHRGARTSAAALRRPRGLKPEPRGGFDLVRAAREGVRRFLKLLKREFSCFFVSSSFQLTLVASEAFFKSFKNSVQGAKVNSLREEKRDLGQGVGGEKQRTYGVSKVPR